MKPTFWKLSQGTKYFNYGEIMNSINDNLVYVHKDTTAKGRLVTSQAENFINAAIGDYFYLTHGNEGIYILGQFTGPANFFSKFVDGWLDRPFRLIATAKNHQYYEGEKKWWTPNDNSTFIKVPENKLKEFEDNILKPFFDISLADYGIKDY